VVWQQHDVRRNILRQQFRLAARFRIGEQQRAPAGTRHEDRAGKVIVIAGKSRRRMQDPECHAVPAPLVAAAAVRAGRRLAPRQGHAGPHGHRCA